MALSNAERQARYRLRRHHDVLELQKLRDENERLRNGSRVLKAKKSTADEPKVEVLKRPPCMLPPRKAVPKKPVTITRAVEIILRDLGNILRRGKFEAILLEKECLSDFNRKAAALTLGHMADELNHYKSELWDGELWGEEQKYIDGYAVSQAE